MSGPNERDGKDWKKKSNKTLRGISDPRERAGGGTRPGHPRRDTTDGKGMFEEQTAVTLPPFVEVELVYERGYEGMPQTRWRALEVWTQNRIYSCDWAMRCVEVSDRKSGKPDPKHPLLGSFLAGGQRKDADAMELTSPLPRPGTEAVFEYAPPRKGFVNTSTITRVVLRLRVLTVPHAPREIGHAWDKLSGMFKLPK